MVPGRNSLPFQLYLLASASRTLGRHDVFPGPTPQGPIDVLQRLLIYGCCNARAKAESPWQCTIVCSRSHHSKLLSRGMSISVLRNAWTVFTQFLYDELLMWDPEFIEYSWVGDATLIADAASTIQLDQLNWALPILL